VAVVKSVVVDVTEQARRIGSELPKIGYVIEVNHLIILSDAGRLTPART
jgi:hypothetical protein